MKKVLAVLIAIMMMVMMMPVAALADEVNETPAEEIVIPENLTVHYINIVKAGKVQKETLKVMVINQSLTMTARGVLNNAGGAGYRTEYNGEQMTFLNVYVLTDKDGSIVTTTEDTYSGETIGKIVAKNYMEKGISDIYIAPVYKVVKNWYIDYKYIDNISTGSGSAKNHNAVESFSHTFKEPEAQEHYRFIEWKNLETGATFQAGDKDTYTENECPRGETTEVKVYAVWQPSVSVIWHDENGEAIKEEESFQGSIGAYSFRAADKETAFRGWLDSKGNEIAETASYKAPGITYLEKTHYTVDLFAAYEEPVIEEPVIEEPIVEEPIVEEPITEEPIVEEPITEEPVVEEPVVEEPITEEPVVEEPIVEEPIIEEPVVEEPVVEEPISEEPITEEPIVEEPIVEEPIIEEPIVEEPIVEEPTIEEPIVEEPVVEEPIDEEPVVEEPIVEEPTIEEPIVEEPVVEEPVAGEPETEEPVAEEPVKEEKEKKESKPAVVKNDNKDNDNSNSEPEITEESEPEITIETENEIPLSGQVEEEIAADAVPLANYKAEPEMAAAVPEREGTWALVNLILSVATVIGAALHTVSYFINREKEDEETVTEKRFSVRIASIAAAIVSVIAFILTEDMRNRMVLLDRWTLMMAVIAMIAGVAMILGRRNEEKESSRN